MPKNVQASRLTTEHCPLTTVEVHKLMKLRPVLLVVLLVGVFCFLPPVFPPNLALFSPTNFSLFHGDGSGSALQLPEAMAAPAYDAEEQNNIAIYKKVLPSVVNITSTTLVYNFFYGTVPQQG